MGLFAADGGPPELVIDDAVSVVRDCTSIDFCLDGGSVLERWGSTAFCSALVLPRNCASCANLLLLGCVLAADAKGKLVS